MGRLLFSLCLVATNLWCATACLQPSSESAKHNKSALPPCHQPASNSPNSPDGHTAQKGVFVHAMVSIAAESTTGTGFVGRAFEQASAPPYSLFPQEVSTFSIIPNFYPPEPPSRPRSAAILRI